MVSMRRKKIMINQNLKCSFLHACATCSELPSHIGTMETPFLRDSCHNRDESMVHKKKSTVKEINVRKELSDYGNEDRFT